MQSMMFYISKFCLLCLKEDDGSLEDVKNKDNSDVTIQEKLDYCVFELISSGHEFPGFICRKCLELLETLYIFKQQCFTSNRKIRHFMDSLKLMQFSALSYRDLSIPVQKLENIISSPNELSPKTILQKKEPISSVKKSLVKQFPKLNKTPKITPKTKLQKKESINTIKESLIKQFPKLNKNPNLFECEHCLKQFTGKFLLKRHMNSHLNIKPYKCTICFKTFTRKDSLKIHGKIHSKVKIDKEILNHKDDLKLHRLKNNKNIQKAKVKLNQKTYQCAICSTTISQKCHLKRHFLSCHVNSKENFDLSYNIIENMKQNPKLTSTVDLTSDELSDSDIELVPLDDEVILLQDEEEQDSGTQVKHNGILLNTRKNKHQNVLNVCNKLNNPIENNFKKSAENLECFVCQKTFTRNCKLLAHVGSHFGDTPYKI